MARKQEVFGITVEGDISGLKKAMNDAVATANVAAKALSKVNEELKVNPTDEQAMVRQYDAYKKAIAEETKALKELRSLRQSIVQNKNYDKYNTANMLKMNELNLAIDVHNKRLKELKVELNSLSSVSFTKRMNDLTTTLDKSEKTLTSYKTTLENLNKQLSNDPFNQDIYERKQQALINLVGNYENELAKLQRRKEALEKDPAFVKGVSDLGEEYTKITTRISVLKKEYDDFKKLVESPVSFKTYSFVKHFEEIGNAFDIIAQKTAKISMAFQGLISKSFDSAVSYETDIANIRRVVSDLTDDTVADLKRIAVETGNTFTDVSEYATIAGALGIAEKDIANFAKTMVDLNTATGGAFSGEEGAKGVYVFLNALKLGVEQADNFGSAIAVIGDKYADIGDETLKLATTMSGLATMSNVTQYDLIGLAGVMADLGLTSEASSSAITRTFVQIEKAVGGGVKDVKEFAKASNMSAEAFLLWWVSLPRAPFISFVNGLDTTVFNKIDQAVRQSSSDIKEYADVLGWSASKLKDEWAKDSSAVIDQYISKLQELDDEEETSIGILSDVELTSIRTIQTLLRLAGRGGEISEAIGLANEAWNENIALQEKSGGIYDTAERKLQGFKESLKQLGSSFINNVLPVIKNSIDGLTNLMDKLSQINPVAKDMILALAGMLAIISPLSKGISGLSKFALGLIGVGSKATILASKIGLALGGVTLAIGSVAAAIAYLEYKQKQSTFYQLNTELNQLSESFARVSEEANSSYSNSISDLSFKTDEYVQKIEDLNKSLKDNTLSYGERKGIEQEIKGYIDELNSTLGEEIFYFDTTSKKILSQKGDIESVKDAYLEYVAEIKKQNWLDAHAEEYNSARESMSLAQQDLMTANRDFVENTKSVDDGIKDMFLSAVEVTGNAQEAVDLVNKQLRESGIDTMRYEQDLSILEAQYNLWNSIASNAKKNLEAFDKAISDYERVQSSSASDLDEILNNIKKSSEESQTVLNTIGTETLPDINEQKRLLNLKFEEEPQLIDGVLTEYGKVEESYKRQLGQVQDIYNQTRDFLQLWNDTTLEPKELVVYTRYVNSMSSSGGYGGSGGFGYNSAGFGDLLNNTYSSIRRSLSNMQFASGGYNSRSITVSPTFNVSANNITREDVRNWSQWMLDDINDELGRAM